MKSIFNEAGTEAYIIRINDLKADTKALWGDMNVAQMLAHCASAFEDSPKPSYFSRLLLSLLAKNTIVGKRPYTKNMKTLKAFIVDDCRDFEYEKFRLIKGIESVHVKGIDFFNGRKHNIFGRMRADQWNTFFTKHLDHHLRQFGV